LAKLAHTFAQLAVSASKRERCCAGAKYLHLENSEAITAEGTGVGKNKPTKTKTKVVQGLAGLIKMFLWGKVVDGNVGAMLPRSTCIHIGCSNGLQLYLDGSGVMRISMRR
jgi:hypothetical protein